MRADARWATDIPRSTLVQACEEIHRIGRCRWPGIHARSPAVIIHPASVPSKSGLNSDSLVSLAVLPLSRRRGTHKACEVSMKNKKKGESKKGEPKRSVRKTRSAHRPE